MVSESERFLYNEIEMKADQYKIPSDAKIDPIWKTIPGYNGLNVILRILIKK